MVMKSLEVEEGHLPEYSPSLYGYGPANPARAARILYDKED